MALVGIPDARRRMRNYPYELSGGMGQRVMIAMALARHPRLLIADEPTTALDVTIQAQILDLLRTLREQSGTTIILITHDLGVIAEMADSVLVMYAGQVVEYAPVQELFAAPKHPYTEGLLRSIPVLGELRDELDVIPGSVPSLLDLAPGCRFADRCPHRMDRCLREEPPLATIAPERGARCWLVSAAPPAGSSPPVAGVPHTSFSPAGG